jgi:hypothetical protein
MTFSHILLTKLQKGMAQNNSLRIKVKIYFSGNYLLIHFKGIFVCVCVSLSVFRFLNNQQSSIEASLAE